MGDNSSSAGGGSLQAGEGSVSPEERHIEATKSCENNAMHVDDESIGKKEAEEKGNGEEGSFFDCNICLDLAMDPIVTCCGHLFCWPCLYRWLLVRSDAKECPVCKGEVTIKNVTPIYGIGNNTHKTEEDSTLKIPLRPRARRIERLRQTIDQRYASTSPIEERIRRLGSRNDSFLHGIVTSRGNRSAPAEDEEDVSAAEAASGDEGGGGGATHAVALEAEISLREEMHQLVDDLASEMRGGFHRQSLEMAEVRADVARLRDDVEQIRGDFAAIRELLERGDSVALRSLLERYSQ